MGEVARSKGARRDGALRDWHAVDLACGVETMTWVPMGSNAAVAGKPFGPRMRARYHGQPFNQGIGAEMIAERWGIDRVALGASGARIMVDLLADLERSGGRFGLQTMCEGGGMANATIIERLA